MGVKADQLIQWRDLSTGFALDRETFGAVPINEAIAAADRFSACAQKDADGPDDTLASWAREYKELAKIYSWFRERHGAQSVGDVIDALEQRKLDLAVVQLLFLDAEVLPGALINAVKQGYPELKIALGQKITEATDDSLERANRIIDAM